MKYFSMVAGIALLASTAVAQQSPQSASRTWAQQTANLELHDGFIPFYFDEKTGKLLFEVSRLDQDFLYLYSLSTAHEVGHSNSLVAPRYTHLDLSRYNE